MSRIPVDVVTGFLGSGKTTLLARLVRDARPTEKIALIVNELGDVGVDGNVLTGLENVEQAIELSSGCVCCTIDDYRFDMAVQEIVDTIHPTLLVIETTGVAMPGPVVERVERAGLGVDAVICVVDALNYGFAARNTRVARAQVVGADFLVVSKMDQVDETAADRLKARLARRNPRAVIVEARHGELENDLPFASCVPRRRRGAMNTAGDAPDGDQGAHLHDDGIESFVWRTDAAVDVSALESVLAGLSPAFYRAKGVVRVPDSPWSRLFNFTCGRSELSWLKLGDEVPGSQGVFIGRGVRTDEARVLQALGNCEVH